MTEAADQSTSAVAAWVNGDAAVAGPLTGLCVLEFVGMGPAPFAAMMLADMGASVLRVDRAQPDPTREDVLVRNRIGTVALDLKSEAGVTAALRLVEQADVLLEGFRPTVMERLGLGPATCAAHNPALVYGRVTGWGQDGPLARSAGHDINYIAITGALDSLRRPGELPIPPLNLVGDYGAGGMLLLSGVLAAVIEQARTKRGTVVDASMVDGTALLLSSIWSARANGMWNDAPGTNRIDGGAPFYNVYRTSDGRAMAVGCIEPHFYALLLKGLELQESELPGQHDQPHWPQLKAVIAERFAERTRDQWTKIFSDTDACVTPVLTLQESLSHPQIRARSTLVTGSGPRGEHIVPAPAPRFQPIARTVGEPGVSR